ncbi:hypothetical protein MNV49_002054 [Pseudohyphozyma bogoriensis]|nr:hypothetical protein MNV49_002054 [Pseudohyphozyma bogoriensis]
MGDANRSTPAYNPPLELGSVAEVLQLVSGSPGSTTTPTTESRVVCVYFHASWSVRSSVLRLETSLTLSRASSTHSIPLKQYAGAPIVFTRFDCAPEEKLTEDTFDLAFEPTLLSLVGPPTQTIVVESETQKLLDENRAKFVELSEKIKTRKLEGAREGGGDGVSSSM